MSRILQKDKILKNTVKYQLSLQRTSLSRAGLLNLSGLAISSLADIGTQKYLKILDVSQTNLESLQSLPPQPNLQQIIADDTSINSFWGLTRHPKLKSVSFINTPLSSSDDSKFRLTMLVLVGPMLSVINGVPVSPKERLAASKYPLIARFLIEANWEIEDDPIPTPDQFRKLAAEHHIRIKGVDPEFTNDEAQKYFIPPRQLVPVGIQIEEYEESENEAETDRDVELQEQIYEELHNIGVTVNKGPEMPKELFNAVKSLTVLAKSLEGCYKEVFGIEDEEQIAETYEDEEEDMHNQS